MTMTLALITSADRVMCLCSFFASWRLAAGCLPTDKRRIAPPTSTIEYPFNEMRRQNAEQTRAAGPVFIITAQTAFS